MTVRYSVVARPALRHASLWIIVIPEAGFVRVCPPVVPPKFHEIRGLLQ
jgi:hypothetical protein